MTKQNLKKFFNDHHLKLWACALGIMVAMSLAALTPSLANNSISAGVYHPTALRTHGPAGALINQASQSSVSPNTAAVQGTTQSAATDQDVAAPSPDTYSTGYKCPMMDGTQADSGYCGHYCTDNSYECGCSGRGADLMCAMPQ